MNKCDKDGKCTAESWDEKSCEFFEHCHRDQFSCTCGRCHFKAGACDNPRAKAAAIEAAEKEENNG